jgi:hypothetical protein
MTTLDRINNNYKSEISISEMNAIADFMNGLNKLDEETWRKMREDMSNVLAV